MARSRNIKPGFFMNETLCALEPYARLLFAGLWTIADREGRLEDRPMRIKAEVLPYDNVNVDGLLSLLDSSGFIKRYEHEGVRYLQILTWWKHQNPHKQEKPSEFPAPDKNCFSTEQEQYKNSTNPADSLNTDSLNRIPSTASRVEVPFWVPLEQWEMYCEHRGAKFSEKAQRLALNKLESLRGQGSPPKEVLEQSVMNGWKGLFEVKGQRHVSKSDERKATLDALTGRSRRERDITADSVELG